MSFSEKQINVQFSLASGQFEGGGNSASITGLRVAAQIEATGGQSQSKAEIVIYGMELSLMNQLATIGAQFNARYENGIDVFAGDASGTALAFSGVVYTGFVDAQSMPETCFRVVASPSTFVQVKPMTPLSIQGSADAAGLMQQLAGQMGLSFQNNGVTAKLANPYYAGSAWQSSLEIAEHGGFDLAIERGVMTISPRGEPSTAAPFDIVAGVNLVSYPSFIQNKIALTALYDSSVRLNNPIRVQSSLKGASGLWQVIGLTYDLESITPGGNWYMHIEAVPVGTQ